MGVVYKARDTRLDRLVAIKILPPEKVSDPERKRRFVQEARSASSLNHPNIVTIYDIDRSDGITFRSFRALDERDPSRPYFRQVDGEFDAGLDAKVVLRDRFVVGIRKHVPRPRFGRGAHCSNQLTRGYIVVHGPDGCSPGEWFSG